MSRSTLSKHYQRLTALWPKDALRAPEQQFTKILAYRSSLSSPTTTTTTTTSTTSTSTTSTSKSTPSQPTESSELRNINALYSLLDNRYSKKYPTPKHVLAPQSNEAHYTDLMAELEKAPRRGWWENLVEGLKGRIRVS